MAIVYSIRNRNGAPERTEPPAPPPSRLAELIAEERCAWDAAADKTGEADRLWFVWGKEHPEAKKEEEQAAMVVLYDEVDALVELAQDATDRVAAIVPVTLADCVQLLAWHIFRYEETRVEKNILAGLRIIAGTGEPVTGDRRILGLFAGWLPVFRRMSGFPDTVDDDDPAWCAACDSIHDLEQAIIETPADGMVGIAVKFFIERYQGSVVDDEIAADIARIAPDLAHPR